ncbi:MAG: CCA tRNA nucleotidyltransferase [Pirellulaceae bacterium]
MTDISPDKSRQFATLVVERLRQAGYQAYWAGGCVRDEILGITPQDYDVATSAVPDQIEEVFHDRKTLVIGASFGVITVLGPRSAGQIEVATFRRDATYSDGRHPDHVSFTTAEEDASRRDFTINGMFFDPLENQVIDFVAGQADLERKLIRAIGDPQLRFAEDKLRILRAVRFAATFGFQVEAGTRAAIDRHAQELKVVSAERITVEMQRMLTHPGRSTAVQLLQETGLLAIIFPESEATQDGFMDRFQVALAGLDNLDTADFATALALLWSQLVPTADRGLTESVMRRMKLSNEAIKSITWMLDHEPQVVQAETIAWPDLQRILIDPRIDHLLALAAARQQARQLPMTGIEACRQKQLLAPEKLNPPPLLSGNDLQELGLPAGPLFREILEEVRNAQLMEQLQDKQQALEWVRSRWPG